MYSFQLLSEAILVGIASAIVIYEYNRSSQKDEEKQRQIEKEKREVKDRIEDLEFAVEKQSAQLKELTRLAISIRDDLEKSLLPRSKKTGFFGGSDDTAEPIKVHPIPSELMNVFEKDNLKREEAANSDSDQIQSNSAITSKLNPVSYNLQNMRCTTIRDEHIDRQSLSFSSGTITKVVEKYLKSNQDYMTYRA